MAGIATIPYVSSPWVLLGALIVLSYGVARGLLLSRVRTKSVQGLMQRLSVYVLIVGVWTFLLGVTLETHQFFRDFFLYRIALWALATSLMVVFLAVLLAETIKSTSLRRSGAINVSSFLFRRYWYIIDIRTHFPEGQGRFTRDLGIDSGTPEDLARNLIGLSEPLLPTRRKHIICLDGTWNDAESDTNVRRFFDLLNNDTRAQIARYYTGVGVNENDGLAVEVLGGPTNKTLIACATGMGERAIRWKAYLDLITWYQPGDELVILGFSRGAACARILANHIHEYGIPERVQAKYQRAPTYRGKPIGPDLLRELVVVDGKKWDTQIEMLGLWDTVAAFGLPSNKIEPFRRLTIPANVRKVYHLVGIDERRWEFDATLIRHEPRVEEIWFAGAHTNVGGGSGDTKLSDISLCFMINRARERGIEFQPEALEITGDVRGPEWRLWPLWPTRIRRRIRVSGGGATDLPRIHKSVRDRMDAGIGYDPPNVNGLNQAYTWEETA